MISDFSEVELGFVVDLRTLRDVLQGLNIDGRRWFVASDPQDAIETGYVILGHGCEGCIDPLNTLNFRVPVVGVGDWNGRVDRLILMIDPSTVTAEEPGFYLGDGRIIEDSAEDFLRFYEPIERALITRMQARN
jgi:hypothetical protein